MVSVVLLDNGEPSVVQYTFEHLFHELKDIPGSELLVKRKWDLEGVKNRFVCFVEPDCLVSKGYFKNQIEVFDTLSPRVVILSPKTAVKYWHNYIYGYYLADPMVIPNRKPKANRPHPLQIAYIPGSLMRTSSLKRLLTDLPLPRQSTNDLVFYSTLISLGMWEKGISSDGKHPDGQLGTQVYINPNSTYVTTEDYINDIADFQKPLPVQLLTLFARESI